MILLISEEYGCRHWTANLTDDEYKELIRRWETMRGLYCSVPVRLICPQAIPLLDREDFPENTLHCHIHQYDDSHLDGTNYKIPDDEFFWIDGKKYEYKDLMSFYD